MKSFAIPFSTCKRSKLGKCIWTSCLLSNIQSLKDKFPVDKIETCNSFQANKIISSICLFCIVILYTFFFFLHNNTVKKTSIIVLTLQINILKLRNHFKVIFNSSDYFINLLPYCAVKHPIIQKGCLNIASTSVLFSHPESIYKVYSFWQTCLPRSWDPLGEPMGKGSKQVGHPIPE